MLRQCRHARRHGKRCHPMECALHCCFLRVMQRSIARRQGGRAVAVHGEPVPALPCFCVMARSGPQGVWREAESRSADAAKKGAKTCTSRLQIRPNGHIAAMARFSCESGHGSRLRSQASGLRISRLRAQGASLEARGWRLEAGQAGVELNAHGLRFEDRNHQHGGRGRDGCPTVTMWRGSVPCRPARSMTVHQFSRQRGIDTRRAAPR